MFDYIFDKCVSLLYILADLFGTTYEVVNVMIFCFIWSLLTILLFYKAYFKKDSKT
jgi:hypothetical protein